MNREHEQLTLWGLSHVTIEPSSVILDVGCGGGKTVSRLTQRAPKGKVYGLDYSPDMVAYSKKLNQKLIAENRAEIVEGKVEQMNFPDGFFDLVTAIETYYFWSNFPAALAEINRVLKLSGKLLMVNEMVADGKYEVENAKLIAETHVRLIPLEEIRKAMHFAGFVAVQVFTKPESPWNGVLAQKAASETLH
jgi:ubiquinone/menaquinone biosynthesis C-methylase UbiE